MLAAAGFDSSSSVRLHPVEPDDTLEGICIKFNVDVCLFILLLLSHKRTHMKQPVDVKRLNKIWSEQEIFSRSHLTLPATTVESQSNLQSSQSISLSSSSHLSIQRRQEAQDEEAIVDSAAQFKQFLNDVDRDTEVALGRFLKAASSIKEIEYTRGERFIKQLRHSSEGHIADKQLRPPVHSSNESNINNTFLGALSPRTYLLKHFDGDWRRRRRNNDDDETIPLIAPPDDQHTSTLLHKLQ